MRPLEPEVRSAESAAARATHLDEVARRHLWPHFTKMGAHATDGVPVFVRGEGCYVYDSEGKRYLDGTAGHFCVNAGHGRTEFAVAASAQMRELAYWSNWGYANPPAIDLAARLAELAPGDLNRVFLTSGGSEAVESALKLARNYHWLRGEAGRTKVIARVNAYHGTTFGALSATGVPSARTQFEPLLSGARHVPNTASPWHEAGRGPLWAAEAIEDCILFERPESVSCVILEPMQNVGGCLEPPPGYFERVREICDRHGVLLISDEVISGWGRIGHIFAGERYGVQPDMITTAKGLASGYAPVGALIASDRVAEPFISSDMPFSHGFTFGGHPVACAVALANIALFEREDLCGQVRRREAELGKMLRGLSDIPIVGDIRGAGYFWGISLVRDKDSSTSFSPEETSSLVSSMRRSFHELGLICKVDDRGGLVVQLAPPLIAGDVEFGEMEAALRKVLSSARLPASG